jgi:TonB family protein
LQAAAQPKFASDAFRRRFAAAFSLAVHGLIILLIGLWAGRTYQPAVRLIPVELTFTEQAGPTLVLGGAGAPKASHKTPGAPAEKPASSVASLGANAKPAPAPPKILTAKSGLEPAGPIGKGSQADGPGGPTEESGGPSYGASAAGGPLPIYPKNALDQGLEGKVVLAVKVGANGKAESVTITQSSGQELLDQAAVRAAKNWAFQSAMAKGKPAAGNVTLIFEFTQRAVKGGG